MALKRVLDGIAWLGTILVFGALVAPSFDPALDPYSVYAAWAGIACIAVYTVGQWREIRDFFRQRNARYGAVAGASVLIVIGLLVAVNYLSARRNTRWDLTANQIYSLSDQTVRLLQDLDGPVRFLVFDVEANFQAYRTLDEYEFESDLVEVEYVDADRNPARARQYEIDAYGTIIVEYGGRTERVTANTEQDLTNGLIRALTGTEKTVYFLQGHGERDSTDTERNGYAAVTAALGRDNYTTQPLVLAQTLEVPGDASVVVVAGPTTDLFGPEVDVLRRYLEAGGHVLVLLDPPAAVDDPGLPLLSELLAEWGIEPGNNVVVDASGMGQLLGTDASVPVAATYPQHPVTDGFNVLTAYPMARTMTPLQGGADGRFARTIIETSAQSWAEANVTQLLESGEVAREVDQGDVLGPVSIGAVVSAPAAEADAPLEDGQDADPTGEAAVTPEARLVAIGDSDFAANYALGIQGNQDLFVNAVNWLAQQENLIAIRPRQAADTRLTLTASQLTGIFWLSILVVPAAVFGAGLYSWSRRRQ